MLSMKMLLWRTNKRLMDYCHVYGMRDIREGACRTVGDRLFSSHDSMVESRFKTYMRIIT